MDNLEKALGGLLQVKDIEIRLGVPTITYAAARPDGQAIKKFEDVMVEIESFVDGKYIAQQRFVKAFTNVFYPTHHTEVKAMHCACGPALKKIFDESAWACCTNLRLMHTRICCGASGGLRRTENDGERERGAGLALQPRTPP